MTPSCQSIYNLLDDEEFDDMDDVSEEEWDEECDKEEEDEVEKEGGSDNLTGFFCEKSGHNNDDGDDLPEDEDELWSDSAQKGLQHCCS
ncbi:hypothetical protein BGX24_005319 [Mortierella sp. AD032]|nr:hypothetical protein BGX24_005319 [Mortierella sp. AD032]